MSRIARLGLWWVAMRCQDHLGAQLASPPHRSVEVVDLDPQQDAVAVRVDLRIT